MNRHEWFDLWLHSDDELSAVLNSPVTARETLHQWPLSCVQRITTADGRRHIYKTQYGPTVEAAFYTLARSDLLVPARTLYEQDGHVMMLFDYVAAPLLQSQTLTESDAAKVGHRLLAHIAAIKGDVPYLVDVSRPERWRTLIEETGSTLQRLAADGHLTHVTDALIERLYRCALNDIVLAATRQRPGLVHGDLNGDNVFMLPGGGWRVIDWARPLHGPVELDLATLLESLGADARRYVNVGVLTMLAGLRTHWLAQCAAHWFPAGIPTYDEQIADLIRTMPCPSGAD